MCFVALFVLFSILLGVNVNAASIDDLDEPLFYFKGENVDAVNGGMSYFTEVDGYTVNYWYLNHQGVYTWFDGSLNAFTLSPIQIYVDIAYPESIARGEIFDIVTRFEFLSGFSEVSSFSYKFYSLSWQEKGFNDLAITSVNNVYSFSKNNIQFDFVNNRVRLFFYWTPGNENSVLDFYLYQMTLDVVSDKGLLSSIVDTITNIFSSITNLPVNIANSIKGFFDNVVNAVNKVFTAISELPAKIWNLIETGLKNLFVPTEEDLQEYYDKWNVLMSERFGALYEVVNIVTDFIDSFKSYNETGTIDFPAVTVDLAGSPFTFGGWTVAIVPDGFGLLFDSLKLAIDMVCTYAFVFGMKKRYEDLVERG